MAGWLSRSWWWGIWCTTVHMQIVLQLVSHQLSCLYQVHISCQDPVVKTLLYSLAYFSLLFPLTIWYWFLSHLLLQHPGNLLPTTFLSTSGISAWPPSSLSSLVTPEAEEANLLHISLTLHPMHHPLPINTTYWRNGQGQCQGNAMSAPATSSFSFYLATLIQLL